MACSTNPQPTPAGSAETITAAVAARQSDDFIIVARTDAVATQGLDEAVDRANAALDAGADVAFVEALTTMDETAAVPARVHGPCLLNIVPGGKGRFHRRATPYAFGSLR